MSVSTLGRLENGERSANIDELYSLCKKFDKELSFFLSDSPTIMMNDAQYSQGFVSLNVVLVDKGAIDSINKSLDELKISISKLKK